VDWQTVPFNKSIESDDIHSCNSLCEDLFLRNRRWNEKYWPGEDTLMCLAIKKTGKKMIEAADVVVYHHRRRCSLKSQAGLKIWGASRVLCKTIS